MTGYNLACPPIPQHSPNMSRCMDRNFLKKKKKLKQGLRQMGK
jgi:peptide subunit release factor RF-3